MVDLPSQFELIERLALAALLGGILGFERELRDHPAGLRTHITVAVGSALFVIVGAYGFDEFLAGRNATNVNIGVDRVASTVVTGIGFLGGGAILKHGATVKGLTTAGSLWVTAAVGVGCALGSYAVTLAAVVVTVVALVGLRAPEKWLARRMAVDRESVIITLTAASAASPVIAAIAELDVRISSLAVRREADHTILECVLVGPRRHDVAERVAPLAERDDVVSVELG